MAMHVKICPHCKDEFETKYRMEVYCTLDCKNLAKQKAYLDKWVNGKDKVYRVKPIQRMVMKSDRKKGN